MKYRKFFTLTSIQNAYYHGAGKSKKKFDLYNTAVEINQEEQQLTMWASMAQKLKTTY